MIDEVTAAEPGTFDVKALWRLGNKIVRRSPDPPGTVRNLSGATLSCASPVDVIEGAANSSTAVQMHTAKLGKGSRFFILNMLYGSGHPREYLRKLGTRAAVVVTADGITTDYVGVGVYSGGTF